MKVQIGEFFERVVNNQREGDRYKAYQYCHEYFSKTQIDLEIGCLHLWSYLASWGMLRGSSNLLQCHSYKSLMPMIKRIADWKLTNPEYWSIDVSNYQQTKGDLVCIYNEIKRIIEEIGTVELQSKVTATNTLITKIMLGVWGSIPAIDVNFSEFLKDRLPKCKKSKIEKIIDYLSKFYEDNKLEIDDLANKHKYSKAKIIDMYGFAWGDDQIKERKKTKTHNKLVPEDTIL